MNSGIGEKQLGTRKTSPESRQGVSRWRMGHSGAAGGEGLRSRCGAAPGTSVHQEAWGLSPRGGRPIDVAMRLRMYSSLYAMP